MSEWVSTRVKVPYPDDIGGQEYCLVTHAGMKQVAIAHYSLVSLREGVVAWMKLPEVYRENL